MKLKAGLLALGMVAIIAATFAATVPDEKVQRDPEQEALPVSVVKLQPVSSIDRDREFSGMVKAARRTQLAFERSARLMKVNVDEGDAVVEKQPLAVLDQRQLQTEIDRTEAMIKQQSAVLKELVRGARDEVIAATKAEWKAAAADADLRKLSLERVRKLNNRNAASDQQLDEARLSYEAAVARTDAIFQRYEELKTGTRQEKLDAQQAMVDSLNADLERLKIAVTDSTLEAPFAGTVTRRLADEGDMLSPGQPILELVESGKLEAHVGVPPAFVRDLTEGSSYALRADDTTVQGTLRKVVRQVDSGTRTQTVILDLPGAGEYGIADGRLIRLSLTEAVEVKGFVVPTTALSAGDRSLWRVYIASPSDDHENAFVVEARSVESVYTDGNSTVIRGTVYPGELLVTEGVHRVVPGQLVVVDGDWGGAED